jgi:hypothetical protein
MSVFDFVPLEAPQRLPPRDLHFHIKFSGQRLKKQGPEFCVRLNGLEQLQPWQWFRIMPKIMSKKLTKPTPLHSFRLVRDLAANALEKDKAGHWEFTIAFAPFIFGQPI